MREIRMLRTTWRKLETGLRVGLRHRNMAKASGQLLLPVPVATAPAFDPTREGGGVRFPSATRLVILVDAHPRQDWLMVAVERRLREELARLHVVLNESKSRVVDQVKGDAFGFLGFDFRRALEFLRTCRHVSIRWKEQVSGPDANTSAILRAAWTKPMTGHRKLAKAAVSV